MNHHQSLFHFHFDFGVLKSIHSTYIGYPQDELSLKLTYSLDNEQSMRSFDILNES